MAPPSSLSLDGFSVHRREPELIKPAEPTPYEFKPLSDIDDQDGLRFEMPVIYFYRGNNNTASLDPVKVIKESLSKALVFYYPMAGRVREGPSRKLIVECNEEGVMFVEADANVSLDHFGDELPPPSPYVDELAFDVKGSGGVVDCPIFLIQVTRLTCGGFVLSVRLNHVMCDAAGLVLFTNALAEMARGLPAPTVAPVWSRELLNARNPPRVLHPHPEYEAVVASQQQLQLQPSPQPDDMVHKSFFFGPSEISALRSRVRPQIRRCSAFELLSACIWRSRTMALLRRQQQGEEQAVRIILVVNARDKYNPPLPAGYYGNGFHFAVAVSTARELCRRPLGYALELVMRAKEKVRDEYVREVSDLMRVAGRPHFTTEGAYLVSDVTNSRLEEFDFGWGNAVYGGPAKGGVGAVPGFSSFFIKYKNGRVVPLCLPSRSMLAFEKEILKLTKVEEDDNNIEILARL